MSQGPWRDSLQSSALLPEWVQSSNECIGIDLPASRRPVAWSVHMLAVQHRVELVQIRSSVEEGHTAGHAVRPMRHGSAAKAVLDRGNIVQGAQRLQTSVRKAPMHADVSSA